MANADLQVHTGQVPRLTSRAGVRVREDTVYADHRGREQKGVRKRADKALDKLQETLAKVLEPDEAIMYVARCQAPAGILEQFAFGWYIYYVTATVLVFTNRRLLHFLVRRDGSWKKSLRSLRWGDLSEAKVHGLFGPRLRLKYQDGKVETYWGLRRGDAKTVKILLPVLLSASPGETSPAQAMSSLCPECFAGLSPGVYQCSRCGLTFKDEKTMVRRSLLIPGGGYFYTGHCRRCSVRSRLLRRDSWCGEVVHYPPLPAPYPRLYSRPVRQAAPRPKPLRAAFLAASSNS